MSKFEQTFCSQCGGSFGAGDSGYSHCYDHQSPGVRKAMTRFWAGLTERRVAEFGLPWHVEPWGDGSKPPYVNILSESHAVVIAADLERDVANWIVSMANAAISPIEAEEPKAEGEMREGKVFSESDRCEACGYMRWHGDNCPRCESRLTPRPKTSDADEWQLWLQDGLQSEPATGIAFLAVQIVEAIEEHQKALAREVYALAEGAAERFGDVAAEDTPEGHYCRGAIHEAKSIAKAINAIMPYSRDPAALSPKESA